MVQGKWNITIKTPMGDKSGVLDLKTDGAALTGSLSSDEYQAAISDGKVDGNKLSWSAKITKPMRMRRHCTPASAPSSYHRGPHRKRTPRPRSDIPRTCRTRECRLWHLTPDFVCQRSDTRWHAYWLANDCSVAQFTETQRRLAIFSLRFWPIVCWSR